MPLSHACPSCGTELCRVRAAPDPVYALPVVVCPRCTAAWVRRRHPISVHYRAAMRIFASVRHLVMQAVLVFIFVVLLSAFLHSLRQSAIGLEPPFSRWLEAGDQKSWAALSRAFLAEEMHWVFFAWACFSTGLGMWLAAGLAHWRLSRAILGWVIVMLCVMAIPPALDTVQHWAHQRFGLDGLPTPPQPGRLAQLWALVIVTLPLTIPGMFVGVGMRRIGPYARQRGARKRLRALRRWRNR